MNASTTVAEALVGELVRQRVAHVVLAPGSRSAPLAFAFAAAAARGDVRLHVRIDERSAAFTALGLARVSGPVAVVATSGTAVANLHPAVLEASHSGVPVIALTADRPHEMRGTGANQTTNQVGIFGMAVRFFAEVPAPYGRPGEDADVRNLLGRAVAAANGIRTGDSGPVHLNLAFREPLVPDLRPDTDPRAGADRYGAHESHDGQTGPDLGAWSSHVPGATDVYPARAHVGPHDVGPHDDRLSPFVLRRDRRTVVLAGDGAGRAAREFAVAGGFPLLAEPSSGARSAPNALGPYRLLLDGAGLGALAERAVVFGHPTLSRPVEALLARRDVEVVVVAPGAAWPDAARNASCVVSSVDVAPGAGDERWLNMWLEADATARRAIDGVLDAGELTGPLVAREVWSALRPGQALVVGSSNPIRDLDLAAHPSVHNGESGSVADAAGANGAAGEVGPALVIANRGLAGIDGTLSTAGGVSLASGRMTRVLVGDLAFLHDVGGLLVGRLEEAPQLQIVVVNDDGGGIFSLLEQGAPEHAHVFERVFGTPHGTDLASLCAGYGVRHTRVHDVDGLRAELADPAPGRSVVEVPVDRSGHRDLYARLRSAVAAELAG